MRIRFFALAVSSALVLTPASAATPASGRDLVSAVPVPRAPNLWTDVTSTAGAPRSDGPPPARIFRLDAAGLVRALSESRARPVQITLPLPDGRIERFEVVEASIFGPEFQRAHPELRTYRAAGLDDRTLEGRIDATALGVRAIVFAPDGIGLIDPLVLGRPDPVASRWLGADASLGPFDCDVIETAGAATARPGTPSTASIGDQLKTVRFILMATGEYTQTLGGQAAALAQMTTSMNRINGVLGRDLATRLQVVQMRAFDDSLTDPYPYLGSDVGSLAARNGPVVDSIFGSSTYDDTQVISHGGTNRGIAFRPFECIAQAGSAVSGPDPTGNQFDLHVMPHEIGHSLGATHTQDRSCNRSLTPYELGSGVTIMSSLGGACPPEFQPFADPYYHVCSIEQMDTISIARPDCGTLSPSGNTPPTADAGPDFVIPTATPFVLAGHGADADPTDALTYTWEQFDMAATTNDPINGPLFRWRPPSPFPLRAIPALATVLSGASDPYETLPISNRLLHFRLLVRDNHPGVGGVAWDDMTITVSGAPFAVTSPNGGEMLASGVPFTVTWNVGGGAVAANVNLLLTTDGGLSWETLASNTPNDGSESVSEVVSRTRSDCRIKIEPVGNIFYDVSNAAFTIVSPVTARPNDVPVGLAITVVAPNPATGSATITYALPASGRARLSVIDVQGRTVATLVDGFRTEGLHHASWSGLVRGRRAPGLYFVRLESGGSAAIARAVIAE